MIYEQGLTFVNVWNLVARIRFLMVPMDLGDDFRLGRELG